MNFTAEFIQVCFQCSADFIQPSFHLFCDAVMRWSVSMNRALLSLFFDLHCGFTCHVPVGFTSTGWRLNCWSPSLSAVMFSSCSRSWYRGTVTSSSPASQASCRFSFSPCCSHAEVARILLTLISPVCTWKGKTYRHRIDYQTEGGILKVYTTTLKSSWFRQFPCKVFISFGITAIRKW